MSHTDAIADFLTRIRNGSQAGLPIVAIPYSVMRERLGRVLVAEGFLNGMEVVESGERKILVVALKYVAGQRRVITGLERVSKPGRRMYVGYNEIKAVRSGMGLTILSTPKGIVSDAAARKLRVGGEILCRVW